MLLANRIDPPTGRPRWWPFLGAALALLAPAVVTAEPAHRPMDEMHGTCAAFQMDLRDELRAFAVEPNGLMAWPAQGPPADRRALSKPTAVTLLPREHVALSVEPKRAGAYAGLVGFRVARAGRYRLSVGSPAWIDVVGAGGRIEPVAFEMQSQCPTLFKTVVFPLEAAAPYWVELSASQDTVALLLTEEPAGQ